MNTAGFYFQSYEEWRQAITVRCGIALTPAYATERSRALRDLNAPGTRDFLHRYGEDYLQQVIAWFERARTD